MGRVCAQALGQLGELQHTYVRETHWWCVWDQPDVTCGFQDTHTHTRTHVFRNVRRHDTYDTWLNSHTQTHTHTQHVLFVESQNGLSHTQVWWRQQSHWVSRLSLRTQCKLMSTMVDMTAWTMANKIHVSTAGAFPCGGTYACPPQGARCTWSSGDSILLIASGCRTFH